MLRALCRNDLPQLASLHQSVWGLETQSACELRDSYERLFPALFMDHPWTDDEITSLVVEEDSRPVGLLGVMPRTMSFHGQPVRVAISSQLCVDSQNRSKLAGVQLLKRLFSGPQDLTIADMSNAMAARVWTGVGGWVVPLLSLQWLRVLRPCQMVLSLLRRQSVIRRIGVIGRPVAGTIDVLIRKLPRGPFQIERSPHRSVPLTFELFHQKLPEFTRHAALRPEYDEASARWVWERAAFVFLGGELHRVAVVDHDNRCLGWFLYHLSPDGTARVIQLVALPQTINAVLTHLFEHADQRGAITVTGRASADFLAAFSDKQCLFHRRGKLFLAQTRNPELRAAIDRGDLFFSLLEGEGCLNLGGDPVCQLQAMSAMMSASHSPEKQFASLPVSAFSGDHSHEIHGSGGIVDFQSDRNAVASR